MASYLDQLVRPIFETVGGWNDSGDDSTRMFRTFVMDLACLAGIGDCVNAAGEKFERLVATSTYIKLHLSCFKDKIDSLCFQDIFLLNLTLHNILYCSWRQGKATIEPNFRQLVYSYGMSKAGNSETWSWMLELYKNETNAQEKTKLMKGLVS